MNRDDDFSNAGDVLRNLFDKLIPEETRNSAQVLCGWTDIVGSETSMHVIPVDVRNHALLLESDHPGWSQRIRMRQEIILRTINAKYPDLGIKYLKIRVSDGRSRKNEATFSQDFAEERKENLTEERKPELNENHAGLVSNSEEDKDFFDLLEKMRRRSDP